MRSWARESAAVDDTPPALEMGGFIQSEIDAIPNGEEADFFLRCRVERASDGTLAYIGGTWQKEEAGGGSGPTFRDLHRADTLLEAEARTMRDTGFAVASLPDVFMVSFHVPNVISGGYYQWIRKSEVLATVALADGSVGASTNYIRCGDYSDIQTYVGRTPGGNLTAATTLAQQPFDLIISEYS